MAEISTRPLYKETVIFFARLVRLLENPEALASIVSEDRDTSAIGPAIHDGCGRFKVWAENVGAHRGDRLSLDHRLREATRMKHMVVRLLEDLITALRDAGNIIDGSYHDPHTYSFDDVSWASSDSAEREDAEIPLQTPFEDRLNEISHIITCLYKFSIAMRNPTPRDRLEKCAHINVSHYEYFDVSHVAEKFPNIKGKNYLMQRLGKANTRRRQLLLYHEKHHQKIVGHRHAANEADVFGTQATKTYPQQFEEGSIGQPNTEFTQTATTVSTFLQPTVQWYHETSPLDTEETRSEGGVSQTTYNSSSSSEGSGGQLHVPDPPANNPFDGVPFQCPYCFVLISPNSQMSWMKHVYRDLRPYVCTFESCARAEYLFASRQEWFEHERAAHRREWHCDSCNEFLTSKALFVQHVQTRHPDASAKQAEVLVQRAEGAIESEQSCPLCDKAFIPRQLQSHLGRHMQQIALFILPGACDDDAETVSLADSSESDPDDKNLESYQRALDDYEKTLGKDHPDTLNTVNNMARVYDNQGEHSTALAWYQRALDDCEKTLGKDHPDTLNTINGMAGVFNSQGDYDKALAWYQRALDGREKAFGKDHPYTLDIVYNMANIFQRQGEHSKALAWYQRALEGREKAFGKDHPNTLALARIVETLLPLPT